MGNGVGATDDNEDPPRWNMLKRAAPLPIQARTPEYEMRSVRNMMRKELIRAESRVLLYQATHSEVFLYDNIYVTY
jgi:hypothetical protein